MATPTKEKLAQALHAAGLFKMEHWARQGHYDDFESDLATPISQLVAELQDEHVKANDLGKRYQIEQLIKRAMNGDFDATKEESDAWYAREGKQLLEGGQ